MPRGGYQKPAKPAPVSAPGRLSRRTDGGPAQTTQKMTGLPYGENADFNEMQSSAPLRATPGAAMLNPSNPSPAGGGTPPPAPMFSPSQRPNEPVTAGAPFGPGAGPMRPERPKKTFSTSMQLLADATGDTGLANTADFLRRMGQ
jgi:hypothetical protein